MKEKQVKTINSSEILRLIMEENYTIWDLSILLNVNLGAANSLKKLLIKCCDNDTKKVNLYFSTIKKNNDNYLKNNINKKYLFTFNILTHLANARNSQVEIMRKMGHADYSTFKYHFNKMLERENISPELKKILENKIKDNKKNLKVIVIYNNSEEKSDAHSSYENQEGKNSDSIISSDTDNTTNNSIEVVNSIDVIDANKIVIYTYEYLKNSENLEDEFLGNEEKIILSSTLELILKDKQIHSTKKYQLTKYINISDINLRILSVSSNYAFNKINDDSGFIAFDNDVILSQALMLSRYTQKDIYIATNLQKTALNALNFCFGIRVSKVNVIEYGLDYLNNNDTLNYFDYKLPKENDVIDTEKVYVLDTCFIIANESNNKNPDYKKQVYKYMLKERNSVKLVFLPILEELKVKNQFFTILYAAKFNPSIKFVLYTKLYYNYVDTSLLNLTMFYQNIYKNHEFYILTHDYTLFMESLQYNVKSYLYQKDFENLIGYNLNIEESEEKEDFSDVTYKTIRFTNFKGGTILLNNAKIEKVVDHTNMTEIKMKGHNSFKYYLVNIGDYISFKGDKVYKINSFEEKDNLISVHINI